MPDLSLFDLTGSTALVTGASRGIGRAIASGLARAGCHVALNARTENALKETAEDFARAGAEVHCAVGDIADEASVKSIVESTLKAFGKIDILVNNAGVWAASLSYRMSRADWDKVISVNLTGSFMVSKAVSRVMIKQKSGKIIMMSSVQGLRGGAGAIGYSATKGAIVQMTQVMAIELGIFGIQVNAIAPGLIDTDMTKKYTEDKEALKDYLEKSPSKRLGTPEDLVGTAVFLASQASNHLTGQTILVDGGESLV